MPNRNYIKGRRKEYKVVHQERDKDNIAFRSAGSHSPVDVVSINIENKTIDLIQCKHDNMSETSKNRLKQKNIGLNGLFIVKFEVI